MPFRYDVCNVKLQLRVKGGLVLSQEAGGGGGGGGGHISETCSISYMNISKTYF